MSAGDIRTSRVKISTNDAINQQLTPKRDDEGASLDKRLAVAIKVRWHGRMRTFSNNLIFSYVLIVLGIYLLAAAGYDEFRGITRRPILLTDFHRRGTMGHAYLHRVPVRRQRIQNCFANL